MDQCLLCPIFRLWMWSLSSSGPQAHIGHPHQLPPALGIHLAGRGNLMVETLWRVSPVFFPSPSHLWAEHQGLMSTGSLGTSREQSAVAGALLRLPLWYPTNIFLILWCLHHFAFLSCTFIMPQSVAFLIFPLLISSFLSLGGLYGAITVGKFV